MYGKGYSCNDLLEKYTREASYAKLDIDKLKSLNHLRLEINKITG